MRASRFSLLVLAALLLALPLAQAGDAPSGETGRSSLVNVNTAGVDELQTLPGIGPALARRIIEHRREHGPFKEIEDLLEVRGIGERSLSRFRERITVTAPEKS